MSSLTTAGGPQIVVGRLLDDLWQTKAATSPRSLASVLLSDTIVEAVRKELRRQTGYNADVTEIAKILKSDVFRADVL